MKKFGVVLILLLMLQVLLAGCGDGDHTDEWVGRWTVEMLDGENLEGYLETAFKLAVLKGGVSVEESTMLRFMDWTQLQSSPLEMIVVGNSF